MFVIKSNLLEDISHTLGGLRFSLEPDQPHLSEEGLLLMRDKRVLIGHRASDREKVVIKASNSHAGQREITNEKAAQEALSKALFSRESILFPEEIYYGKKAGYLLRVTKFIEQEKVFRAYPLEERFFMVMKEFETQEGFYANTFEHIHMIEKIFPVSHASDYVRRFENFEIGPGKKDSLRLLRNNMDLVENRSNYLTHTDFVPSNFRINSRKVYMIDLSSMHFGNRYEGLARFLNYCLIHDPELEKLITGYIIENRGKEEYLCLRLMRIYKAGFLINHYAKALAKTEGDLQELSELRLNLWRKILDDLVEDIPTEEVIINGYREKRDVLRSEEELKRQKEFNLV